MRDRFGRAARPWVVGVVAGATLVLLPGRCWAVSAQVSAQFHRVEEVLELVRPDGTPFDTTLTNDVWTHTFGIRHARRFGVTNVSSDFNWTDNYYVGQIFRTQTPSLRLSVSNPVYGLTTMYQPSRAKTATSPGAGFLPAGSQPATEVSIANSQRLQLAGYVAPARLPRLDLSWERNHRNAYVFSPQQTSITRSARISHSLGPVSMRLGYNDAARGFASARVQAPEQSAWEGQAGFGINPRPNFSMSSQYVFSAVRRGPVGPSRDRNTTHGVGVGGGYRPRKDVSVDLAYAFRHAELSGRRRLENEAHDGSLGLSYQPIPILSLGLAGGLRTDASQGTSNVARTIVGTARAGGHLRRGWDMEASAAHSWSWDRFRSGVMADNLGGTSRFELRRGLALSAGGQLASTSVPSVTGEKLVATTSLGIITHPFRVLDVSATQGSYAAGPRLGQATSRSRSRSVDATLRASRSVWLQAGRSEVGAQPNNQPRVQSQRYELRWQPSGAMALSTVYTRSSIPQTGATSSQLQGHESVAARWSAALGRSVQLGAGFAATDPGAPSESRQYDATVTKTFGR